jgi:hypothetical protein
LGTLGSPSIRPRKARRSASFSSLPSFSSLALFLFLHLTHIGRLLFLSYKVTELILFFFLFDFFSALNTSAVLTHRMLRMLIRDGHAQKLRLFPKPGYFLSLGLLFAKNPQFLEIDLIFEIILNGRISVSSQELKRHRQEKFLNIVIANRQFLEMNIVSKIATC